MRTHVLNVENQEKSRMHPRFSPFQLRYHKRDNCKVVAINHKGDCLFTFKIADLKLDCNDTNFGLYDAMTYSTLCILTPEVLWKELLGAQANCDKTTIPMMDHIA